MSGDDGQKKNYCAVSDCFTSPSKELRRNGREWLYYCYISQVVGIEKLKSLLAVMKILVCTGR